MSPEPKDTRRLDEWRPPKFTWRMRGQSGPPEGGAGGVMPPIGPLLDREIERALALLRTLPFEELQRRGWHLQPNHFAWPLNDVAFLRDNPDLWTGERAPAAVDLDLPGQAQLARQLAGHAGDLADVPEGPPQQSGEVAWERRFARLDAYLYYGLVRRLRPARVVEVGTGLSADFLARAIAANEAACQVTLIDPEVPSIAGAPRPGWRHVQSIVQRAGLAPFEELEAGDVLFYDGSHCGRTGSDVNWMLFEVFPRLAPGVWIHVHDILWPFDYREQWVLDEGLSWNEQYLLQAFLTGNPSYRVRIGSVALMHYEGELVESLFPGDPTGSTSLWLEKVSRA